MDATGRVSGELPRLLYIGDVSVADTHAGEALLFRLLQFYPPEKLALVCGVRPGMPRLPGVAYHHWGPAFPRLLRSRVAEEYVLWRAWRYFEVPAGIANIATMFRPDAILTISHVSAWLCAWQLAAARHIPFHLIAHDDLVYSDRFPRWSRPWARARFGEAYRAARQRFCVSDTMAEIYAQRFGVGATVIYPTNKSGTTRGVNPRLAESRASLVFAHGGSLNSAADLDQMLAFAKAVTARGHRLIAYTPQSAELARRASEASVPIEVRAPVHSDELMERLSGEADCLFLPQSMAEADRPFTATAFPTKWSDYSTLGLPVLVWAPPGSSSERFVGEHPGCAEIVTSLNPRDLDAAIHRLEQPGHRRALAESLLVAGRAFSPHHAWATFQTALTS